MIKRPLVYVSKNTKQIYIYIHIYHLYIYHIYHIYIYIYISDAKKKSYEYIPWDSRYILYRYQTIPWAPEVAPILIDAARQGLKLGHPAAVLMCWMKRAWKFWKFELGRIWKDFYDFLKDFYDFLWKIWWISMIFYGRYDGFLWFSMEDMMDSMICYGRYDGFLWFSMEDMMILMMLMIFYFVLSRFLFNPPKKNTINPMKYPEFMTYPLII